MTARSAAPNDAENGRRSYDPGPRKRDSKSGRFAPEPPTKTPSLTPKQTAIVQYAANGKTTEEIALLMNTSVAAVTSQLVRIMDVMGTKTRASTVARALRLGLIK